MERTVFFMQCLLDSYPGRSYPFAACIANTGKEARVSFAAPVNDKHWSRTPGYETKRIISSLA